MLSPPWNSLQTILAWALDRHLVFYSIDHKAAKNTCADAARKIIWRIEQERQKSPARFRKHWRKMINRLLIRWLLQIKRTGQVNLIGKAEVLRLAELIDRSFYERLYRDWFGFALDRARSEVADPTWQIFEDAQLKNLPVNEIAIQRGVSILHVYQSVRRVSSVVRHMMEREAHWH
jgi:hypothetical protein